MSETAARRPTARTAMEWLEDYYDCLMGDYGEWWRDRGDQVMEDRGGDLPTDGTAWKVWREIRQNECAPPGDPS